jgi:hypothetical protein
MTTGGWITMILSVGSVTTLFVWCLYKVLTHNPPAEDVVEDSMRDPQDAPRR